MLNMGGTMAKSFISSNMARYQPGVSGFWALLKHYFAVDNAYVLRKFKVLLLPVLKKSWHRVPAEEAGAAQDGSAQFKFARPCVDENAPDLYLPLMAFITHALISGFVKGRASNFTPEVLVEVTSSAMVVQLLEVLLVRLGLYLLGAPAAMLDLVAFTGYKFVALCINMAVGIALGRTGYYVALVYTGLMTAYFMLKTMACAVPLGPASRDVMIAGFAALQFASIWWLGDPKDLEP
ncbi:hypothetical protein JKP88DRAFT_190214 [Tribonema minus]|uniref:Protein YIF1 n=1 Tax=Tribonema minus TaxID=303371 RepID=A0A835YSN9_9STRA|nr:hypothetical protein JKP88DRAFT_190214 [Tribonema minus]|eukprot:TRINITY_DN218_c0_g1_i1.p2 TRINITY_DN218_c0_g1~~TRINITY_DN218_c0_g1_i1.p2  ORF type:complete len:236 (-),score=91.11 TRINITY_DN218_c0_g1_i1:471-1178(-)